MADSTLSHVKKFDVFPSFHGPDIRSRFLSYLHNFFARKGITMFKDQEIERGHTIGSELVQAIRGARVSIVLLSKNYASSGWCLDELVEILKCKEYLGQIVLPIFYDVDPSHVRKQEGDFGIVFLKTCERETEGKKWRWIEALTEVATIAGEHSNNWTDEAAMVEKLATDVSKKLKDAQSRDWEEEMKKEFRDLDKDQNGFISAAELRHAVKNQREILTDDQVEMIIRAADVDGDGQINYDEFVKLSRAIMADEAAMKDTVSEEEVKRAFRMYDKDRNGFISAAEYQDVMKHLGKKVTDQEAERFLRQADVDGDGQISYDELVKFTMVDNKTDEAAMKDTPSEELMKLEFRGYDIDRNGLISAAELRHGLAISGVKYTDEEAKAIVRKFDVDGDGQLNFDEFRKLY